MKLYRINISNLKTVFLLIVDIFNHMHKPKYFFFLNLMFVDAVVVLRMNLKENELFILITENQTVIHKTFQ